MNYDRESVSKNYDIINNILMGNKSVIAFKSDFLYIMHERGFIHQISDKKV